MVPLIDSVGIWNRVDKLIECIANMHVEERVLQHERDTFLRTFMLSKMPILNTVTI